MKYLKDFSEKYLVEEVLKKTTIKKPFFIDIENGDDCCAFSFPQGLSILSTIDPFLENVHFRKDYLNRAGKILGYKKIYKFIGTKAMTINISDILSKGGIPKIALISLSIDRNEKKENFDQILEGIYEKAKENNIYIGGGDIAQSHNGIKIVISMIGTVKKKNIIKRKGARPGDHVYITAAHGESAFGMNLLKNKNEEIPYEKQKYFILKHINPKINLNISRIISDKKYATSMTDSSDGLFRALQILSEASGSGMKINLDAHPVSDDFRKYAGKKIYDYILFGGEDYLPVFTSRKKNCEFFNIGCVTAEKGIKFYLNEKRIKFENKKSFDHFSI